MGVYLNSSAAYTLYKNETKKLYFVDKSRMIEKHNGYYTLSGERVYNPWAVVMESI